MSKKKRYIDIGHGDPECFLWVFEPNDDCIQTIKARCGTHEQLWSSKAMRMWRGRFDKKSMECSVVVPEQLLRTFEYRDIPKKLDKLLRKSFGENIAIFKFNPVERA